MKETEETEKTVATWVSSAICMYFYTLLRADFKVEGGHVNLLSSVQICFKQI